YALVDDDGIFDTVGGHHLEGDGPPGAPVGGLSDGGDSDSDRRPRSFTIEDTAGCSCEQIIEVLGLGNGHRQHGCSLGAMQRWVRLVSP
ncbi:MAG: hypothetical protein KDD47_25500, partial [Acidobacteria bacterium]|nr:hypothetical protein [Acidobacteriota bacterium]